MAGQMVHMEVAYRLAERMGIDEGKAEFILGSVAPDSVYFSESYLEKKVHSHFFENCGPWGDTQDYDQWIVNIKSFWNKYVKNEMNSKKKSYLLGMCVHNLTDYWNDLMIWRVLQKNMLKSMSYEVFKEEYYPEAQALNKWMFQNSSNTAEIFRLLGEAETIDFEDYVTADNQNTMREHLVGNQYNIQGKIDVSGHKYFPSEMLMNFIDVAVDRIVSQLEEFECYA